MSLIDPRVRKQAEILVDYSLKVKPGENVIVGAEFAARPLALEIYKQLLKRGAAEIKLRFSDYEFTEAYYKNASMRQVKSFPQIELSEMKKIDCYIRIGSSTNTRGLTGVDPRLISERIRVLKPLLDWRVEKTHWVVTRFPTHAQAQEADMSLSEYEDFVFKAINRVDWKEKFKEQERLKKLIDATGKVHILGPATDLRLSIKGRKAQNASGIHNMPDGEVFTSVVEDSANGFISYTYPALYLGREYHDIRLEFKDGKVVKANAGKGERDLNKILDTDRGSRYIGELGIGNNYKITRFTKDILFDEKIGGSIHIALGKGYKETGSKNDSAIHWDMIKDLRRGHRPGHRLGEKASGPEGGKLWFDGKLVQKNGRWLINF